MLPEDDDLLRPYWAAQAQFGPFEVGPEEYLKMCREQQAGAETHGRDCQHAVEGASLHECPYRVDVENDPAPFCNCCPACTVECGDNI